MDRARILTLTAAIALAACSSSSVQQGPSDTLRAYAQALEQGRVDDAYRLLSDEAKRSMSLDAFRRAVRENPQDALEIAHAIARPASDPVVTASVVVPSGEELVLVYEGGRWKIDAGAIDLYGQATPRQALMGFLRAYERKRYDVVMRYIPDAEIEGVAPSEEDMAPEPADGPPQPAAAAPGAPAAAGSAAPAGSAPPRAPHPPAERLTVEKLRASWEGPQKDHMNRVVQAIRTALPTATIEETGESASMAYGAGGTLAFVREHGVWKIKTFDGLEYVVGGTDEAASELRALEAAERVLRKPRTAFTQPKISSTRLRGSWLRENGRVPSCGDRSLSGAALCFARRET